MYSKTANNSPHCRLARFKNSNPFYSVMDHYTQESSGKSLKGVIICGSKAGYEGNKTFSLEQTLTFLEQINVEIANSGLSPIPCIVVEGTLVGRSTSGLYRERAYTLNFSWSPRIPAPPKDEFYNTLLEYACQLGSKMEQE